ncbi:NAD-dependent protein deacetylase sirtuin-2 isoform X3 [Haemorhous mexicanus]|uniref:NAD-dependent protein deacetylase sirtuin-2 isoform X3 n=1 Tax=Haemorhous mexicanus TaxID=30427 RepID=UPI0028BEB146|nr:NAD-dependent protein deacetylase sirtuin-2 isoform X3 [Haemorhous mexicanus]
MADRDGTGGGGGAGSGPGRAAPSSPAPSGDPPSAHAAPGARQAEAEQDAESPVSEPEPGASADADMELLRSLLSRTLGLGGDRAEPVLDELSLAGVSRFLKSERCKNIVCMVGAGISTSAGIPDFRSPGTGLYSNLQSYNLPYPEAIFEIGFFKSGWSLETLKRPPHSSPAHGVPLLHAAAAGQGALAALLHPERIFSSLVPKCEKCQGLVKPDIVFFGENLPSRFFALLESDFEKVDLLLIMGTSLQVQPFASLISRVPTNTPRLLINKEKTGQSDPLMSLMGFGGMDFDSDKAYRDVAWLGDCDSGCLALAELLGWKEELEELVRREHAAIDAKGGDRVGGNLQKPRGDEDKDGGNPKKGLGDEGKAQSDPKKSLGGTAKAEKDPKKPQGGDKDKAQNDPGKSRGGSEDPPHSTGGTAQN